MSAVTEDELWKQRKREALLLPDSVKYEEDTQENLANHLRAVYSIDGSLGTEHRTLRRVHKACSEMRTIGERSAYVSLVSHCQCQTYARRVADGSSATLHS